MCSETGISNQIKFRSIRNAPIKTRNLTQQSTAICRWQKKTGARKQTNETKTKAAKFSVEQTSSRPIKD